MTPRVLHSVSYIACSLQPHCLCYIKKSVPTTDCYFSSLSCLAFFYAESFAYARSLQDPTIHVCRGQRVKPLCRGHYKRVHHFSSMGLWWRHLQPYVSPLYSQWLQSHAFICTRSSFELRWTCTWALKGFSWDITDLCGHHFHQCNLYSSHHRSREGRECSGQKYHRNDTVCHSRSS